MEPRKPVKPRGRKTIEARSLPECEAARCDDPAAETTHVRGPEASADASGPEASAEAPTAEASATHHRPAPPAAKPAAAGAATSAPHSCVGCRRRRDRTCKCDRDQRDHDLSQHCVPPFVTRSRAGRVVEWARTIDAAQIKPTSNATLLPRAVANEFEMLNLRMSYFVT
jgi:hypothetical protein